MRMTFTVDVDVERVSGKFASREEIADPIREALEGANIGGVSGVGADAASEYEIVEWEVSDDN